MEAIKNQNVIVRRLAESSEHCFFGYYDVPAFSRDGKYHLCHKVSLFDRLPEKEDVAVIGRINMDTREFIKLAETTAWNFQQGSMLQWHPIDPNKIIYNIRQNGN